MNNTILVTGAAGFIGSAVAHKLLSLEFQVLGIDNINDYYDPGLKRSRLSRLDENHSFGNWKFQYMDIANQSVVDSLFATYKPSTVIHLAAQAGVRYSLENPAAYIQSNLVGFGNILEGCRRHEVKHLIYASSSSVYGGNRNLPFTEKQAVNHPVSLYAATKKSNELMAHAYSHLYGLPATGLRFFTVYGPWGRPDMAPMLFAKAILGKKPIRVFNHGKMSRDFTYIDDVVDGIIQVMKRPATQDLLFDQLNPNPSTSWAPHRIFNVGNNSPTVLLDFIAELEDALGQSAIKQFEPMQPGDVESTAADIAHLHTWTGFSPQTPLSKGVSQFVKWYKSYYEH